MEKTVQSVLSCGVLSWPSSTVTPLRPRTVCLGQPRTKTRLKLCAVLNRNFYVDQHSFFLSSKRLAVLVKAALINWVEVCWRATGDTGTVVKTGTVSNPAAMLFPFSQWKHTLSYINPISFFINTLRLSISSSCPPPLCLFPNSSRFSPALISPWASSA